MKTNQQGFIEEAMMVIMGIFSVGLILLLVLAPFIKWQPSEDLVSGIVYNNTNNSWPNGNTSFSIRASTDTYVNAKNESSYCLPKGSPYIPLVKEAAANKDVKVVVTTKKVFKLASPFTCVDNVVVTRESAARK